RLQTGVLILPTEAGAPQRVASLDHRNLDEGPHKTGRLSIPDGDECVTVNTLHEAIADGVEGRAESPDVFERGVVQALLDGGRDRPQLDQRLPARGVDEDAAGQVPGPQLTDLAEASDIRVIVAVATTRGVVGGPESISHGFDFIEDELVVLERSVRNRRRHALIYGGALGTEPVEQIVGETVQVGRGSVCYSLGT